MPAPKASPPYENPAPRLAHYVYRLRRDGVAIETETEKHAGPFSGSHARYRLGSKVEVVKVVRAGDEPAMRRSDPRRDSGNVVVLESEPERLWREFARGSGAGLDLPQHQRRHRVRPRLCRLPASLPRARVADCRRKADPVTVHAFTAGIRDPERIVPANIDAEQEVLGVLLSRPNAIAAVGAILQPQHFSEAVHGALYDAVLSAVDAGQAPSVGTVRQHLGAAGFSSDLGGGVTFSAYIARLISAAPDAGGLAANAQMIRALWGLRQLAAVGDDIYRDGSGYDPAAKLAERFGQVDELRASLIDRERASATAEQAAGSVLARIETVLQGKAVPVPRTGLPKLDDEIGGGLQPATMTVLAGRPGMGKSGVGVEVCDAVAHKGSAASIPASKCRPSKCRPGKSRAGWNVPASACRMPTSCAAGFLSRRRRMLPTSGQRCAASRSGLRKPVA